MGTEIALRETAALAIQPGQTTWDEFQNAALNQLGLREAGNGDKAVFLHVCQRTGLDPFAKQIYMIGRPEQQDDGKWGKKWTIQTGIKGWRVIRDRAERREGVRGKLSRFTYYDHDDNERKVWTRPEPPAVIEVTYTVIDRNGVETPYTASLRFSEYVQTKRDGSVNAMWKTKAVHMLEKCTEAAVYALAFPEDFSGVHLEDAMPAKDWDNMPDAELDAEYRKVTQRPRVTADQVRARAAQTVKAEVVEPEAPPEPADGPILEATWTAITERLAALEVEEGNRVRAASRIAGKAMKHATEADGRKVLDTLEGLDDGAALAALLDDIALSGDPRGEGEAGE